MSPEIRRNLPRVTQPSRVEASVQTLPPGLGPSLLSSRYHRCESSESVSLNGRGVFSDPEFQGPSTEPLSGGARPQFPPLIPPQMPRDTSKEGVFAQSGQLPAGITLHSLPPVLLPALQPSQSLVFLKAYHLLLGQNLLPSKSLFPSLLGPPVGWRGASQS